MLYFIFTLILLTTLGGLLWPIYSPLFISPRKRGEWNTIPPVYGGDARGGIVFAAIVSIVFFIAGFGLYFIAGSPQIVSLLDARAEKMEALKASMMENAAAVKADPKNLEAWVALGQAFVESGQYAAAANAFKQAVLLSKGAPPLIFAYAKSLIMADGGNVSDPARKSLEMVLLQEPAHEEARYFLAVRKLQDGKTQEAMQEMKSLYRSLPDGSPLKEVIDRQIGR